jgi:hypothetical protein
MKHITISIFLLSILFSSNTIGQITNSISKDSSNIYIDALNTMILFVSKDFKPVTIYVKSEKYILDLLPDSCRNQKIIKLFKNKWVKKPNGSLLISMNRLNIKDARIEIDITLRKKVDNHWTLYDYVVDGYTFPYYYDQKKKSYILDIIEQRVRVAE